METSGRADDPIDGPPSRHEGGQGGDTDPTVPVAPGSSPVPPVVPVAPEATPPPPGSSGGLAGGDWPAQATDRIVDLVGTVRDKTTGPVTKGARGAVLGLFAAVMAVMIAVIAVVALVRFLDEVLPSSVWLPYLVLGVIFVVAGAVVYRRRRAPA